MIKSVLSLVLTLTSVAGLFAQAGEIHYQTFPNRNSTWRPIGDSLTVSFNKSVLDLGGVIKISLVTGEWVTKGSRNLVDRKSFTEFAELTPSLAIGETYGVNGIRVTSGFNSVITDLPNTFDDIYAGKSYFLGTTNNSSQPLKYSSDGITWLNSSMDQNTYFSFYVAHISGDRVLAGGNRIARSFDGGVTFNTVPLWDMPVSTNGYSDLVWTGDSGIYVLGSQGALSNDFGNSWTYYAAPDSVERICLLRGDSLIALPEQGSSNIRISVDAGASWNPWIVAPHDKGCRNAFMFGDTLFLVDKQKVVWRSKNWGNSFELFLHPSVNSLIGSFSEWKNIQARDSMVVALGDAGSMIVSRNSGSHFDTVGQKGTNWNNYHLLKNQNIVASRSDGIYLSQDYGKTWSKSATAFQNPHIYSTDSTENIIAVGTWVSRDGGLTFNEATHLQYKPTITVLPSGKLLNIASGSGFYWVREYDSMGNFTTIDSSYDPTLSSAWVRWIKMLSDTHGWAFFYSPSNEELLVYWTKDGWRNRRQMAVLSQQGSNPVYSHTDLDIYSHNELFLVEGYPDKLLYHSSDTGKTWLMVDSLPLVPYRWAQEFTSATAREPNSWWVTNDQYVIRRNPRTWDQWTNFSFGLGGEQFETLRKQYIYPNPSSGHIELPSGLLGDVEVYDVMGRSLGSFEPNGYLLDLSTLPDGIYFLLYELPDSKAVSKVSLIK